MQAHGRTRVHLAGLWGSFSLGRFAARRLSEPTASLVGYPRFTPAAQRRRCRESSPFLLLFRPLCCHLLSYALNPLLSSAAFARCVCCVTTLHDPHRPRRATHDAHDPIQVIMKTTPNSAAAAQRPRILLRELRKRRHVRRPTLRALRACAEADRRCWYCKQPRRSDSLPCLQLAPENRPYFVCGACQFPNVLCELCPWCLARCDAAAPVAVVVTVRRRLSSPTLLNDAQKAQLARIERHGARTATRKTTSSHACRSDESAPDDLRELGGCEGQPEPAAVDRVRRAHRNAVLYSAADVVATATAVSMSPQGCVVLLWLTGLCCAGLELAAFPRRNHCDAP